MKCPDWRRAAGADQESRSLPYLWLHKEDAMKPRYAIICREVMLAWGRGRTPTIRELMAASGFGGTGATMYAVKWLTAQGWLSRPLKDYIYAYSRTHAITRGPRLMGLDSDGWPLEVVGAWQQEKPALGRPKGVADEAVLRW